MGDKPVRNHSDDADQGELDVLEATPQEEGPTQERREPRQPSADLKGADTSGGGILPLSPARSPRNGARPPEPE